MRDCPDCCARPGSLHELGCDVEQCAACGGQRISCGCEQRGPARLTWSGQWPGTAELVELGWFRPDAKGRYGPNPDAEGGEWPDYNRLAELDWDREKRRFVERG